MKLSTGRAHELAFFPPYNSNREQNQMEGRISKQQHKSFRNCSSVKRKGSGNSMKKKKVLKHSSLRKQQKQGISNVRSKTVKQFSTDNIWQKSVTSVSFSFLYICVFLYTHRLQTIVDMKEGIKAQCNRKRMTLNGTQEILFLDVHTPVMLGLGQDANLR